MKSRNQSSLLTALLIVAVLALASAAIALLWLVNWEGVFGPKMTDGVQYALQKETVEVYVTGCDPKATTLSILPQYKDKPVTQIAGGAFTGSAATAIDIPDSVTMLQPSAFLGSGIQSITIPASVRGIGDAAFKDCAALEAITFLGDPALGAQQELFAGCAALRSVTFRKGIPGLKLDCFAGCPALKEIHLGQGTTLDSFTSQSGATLYVQDASLLEYALRSRWSCAVEDGAPLKTADLGEALDSGYVSIRLRDDQDRHPGCEIVNNTRNTLVLTWNEDTEPLHCDVGRMHFIYTNPNKAPEDTEYITLSPEQTYALDAQYCTFHEDEPEELRRPRFAMRSKQRMR